MFVCQHNGVATSALVLFGAGEDTIVKITGLITSVGAVVAYILAEAHVDAQAAQKGELSRGWLGGAPPWQPAHP